MKPIQRNMNKIFIGKLKNALQSSEPIESVEELINEYEELCRLAKWRQKIIESGRGYKTHKKELERISELLDEEGYHDSIIVDSIDKEIREYFRDIK